MPENCYRVLLKLAKVSWLEKKLQCHPKHNPLRALKCPHILLYMCCGWFLYWIQLGTGGLVVAVGDSFVLEGYAYCTFPFFGEEGGSHLCPPSTHTAKGRYEIQLPISSARIFWWRKMTVSDRAGWGVGWRLLESEWMSLMKVGSAGQI